MAINTQAFATVIANASLMCRGAGSTMSGPARVFFFRGICVCMSGLLFLDALSPHVFHLMAILWAGKFRTRILDPAWRQLRFLTLWVLMRSFSCLHLVIFTISGIQCSLTLWVLMRPLSCLPFSYFYNWWNTMAGTLPVLTFWCASFTILFWIYNVFWRGLH